MTAGEVRREVRSRWLGVLACVTNRCESRSSAIVYGASENRLFIAVAPTSWKAWQIRTGSVVSLTVPVRRSGILTPFLPVAPSAVSLGGRASVYPPGEVRLEPLARLYRRLRLPEAALTGSAD